MNQQRVAELERELLRLRSHMTLLDLLPQALRTIAEQRRPDNVIAETLRTAHHALGFERAIFFRDERGAPRAERAFEDGRDLAAASVVRNPASSASFQAARLGGYVCGEASDLCAPVVDVRRRYALGGLCHGSEAYGYLYVDGPRRDGAFATVRALSAIAAVASQNALSLEAAHELASRDPLTGLINRRALHLRLEREIAHCRARGRSLAYLLLDIDDFKQINDRGGHAAGDAHLQRLANALTAMSRAGDVVARYAGDEFAIVMPGRDEGLTRSGVARISTLLKKQGLRCSIGAAVYPRDGLDIPTLCAAADRALYNAKGSGKDSFAFA